jgi:hypothetical protein
LVFLQPQGQEIPDGDSNEPCNRSWVLEGDGEGQAHLRQALFGWHEEDPGILQGQSSQWPEIRLDHARVPP